MPFEYRKHISRPMLKRERDTLFVFGDNMLRKGLGGQAAEMRGELNAVGIPTKRAPSNLPNAFFTDDDFEEVKAVIDKDLSRLVDHLRAGGKVVWPEDGIGTGFADLENRAPKLWEHLEERRRNLEVIAANN